MFKILGFIFLLSFVYLSASEVQKAEVSKDNNKSVVSSSEEKNPYSRANDIITDSVTSLMWQDDNKSYEYKFTWKDAQAECKNLSLGKYSDWRLPSLKELKYIYRTKPSGDSQFKNIVSGYYWTSTPHPKNKEFALIVFIDGSIHWYNKKVRSYLRCVRGKDLTSSDNKSLKKNKI